MVAGDLRLLSFALLVVVLALGVIALVLRLFRVDVRAVLTPKEWWILAKLAATAFMFFALLIRAIYVGLPPEKFIYGRF